MGFGTGSNNGNDNGPVPSSTDDKWVCRHTKGENTQPIQEYTAGDSVPIQWDFSAAHVGDCALYVTYETDADRDAQKFFKIANFFKCNGNNRQDVSVTLPDWLPAGSVTFRWDWYALHQHPSVEFYSQCWDATITAGANAAPLTDIFTYTIPGLYPETSNTAPGYRNEFNGGEQYMTGPPCALNYGGNSCELTACGTTGFLDVKNALDSGRRRLCADIKESSECEQANNNWNACTDTYWLSQCQLTCGACSDATTTSASGGGDSPTTTASVVAGCEAYAYNPDGGNDNSGGNDDSSSAALAISAVLVFLFVLA